MVSLSLLYPDSVSFLAKVMCPFQCFTLRNTISPWPVWLGWLEHGSVHQKVAGLIPGQGTYLGGEFDPC